MIILTQLKKGCQEKIEQIFENSIDKHLFEYYTNYNKSEQMFPYKYLIVEVRYENNYKEKVLFNYDISMCIGYRYNAWSKVCKC